MEILYHVCKGKSNQEIADELFISKRRENKKGIEPKLSRSQSGHTVRSDQLRQIAASYKVQKEQRRKDAGGSGQKSAP